MKVGVVRERKPGEARVALVPSGVHALVGLGHTVLVEAGAGEGAGFTDAEYRAEGATLVDRETVYREAEIVVKVKEPLPEEYRFFRPGQVLFTYLHLAPDRVLTEALMRAGVTAIAYETVQLPDGHLPLLTPMSEVAGRMAAQVGAQFLEKPYGGRGVLLGGVPGVLPAKVVILGAGTVGQNATRVAVGLGADVTVLDVDARRLRLLDEQYQGRVRTLVSSPYHVADVVRSADLVIGAVLIPGARAPKVVTEPMVQSMRPGSVIVDVAIDQGGSVATVDRATTHDDPIYVKYGVVHYAVANMPGAVPRTSTEALTNATLPYLLKMAERGVVLALREDAALRHGLNVHRGQITHPGVAEAHGFPYVPPEDVLH